MTESTLKCLIITPDETLSDSCRSAFKDGNIELLRVQTPRDCARIIKNDNPSAFILDSSAVTAAEGAPSVEETVEKLRTATAPAVLVVLVAPGESSKRILDILKLGANDVIQKPVKPRLLAEQLKAFIRMSAFKGQKAKKTLASNNKALSLDMPGRRCYVLNGKDTSRTEIKLTKNEFVVLSMLLNRRGVLITYEDFRKRLWPEAISVKEFHHTLLQHVTNIRKKLAQSAVKIENIWGEGYRID